MSILDLEVLLVVDLFDGHQSDNDTDYHEHGADCEIVPLTFLVRDAEE